MSRDGEPHRTKLLAISDTYCRAGFVEQGLASLADLGVEIEVRRWEHPTLVALQEANLAIEQGGPDAQGRPRPADRERYPAVSADPIGQTRLSVSSGDVSTRTRRDRA